MRRAAAWACAVALGFGALACSDPREVELVQEMAALQESRVPKTSLERMKVEADAAEARVAELAPQLDAVRGEIEARKGASAALEAGMQREIARNQALNSDIQAAQDSLRQAVEKQASLEQEVARERARAQTFVDQAGVLSRELRPDDPDWALRLRIRTVEEFLHEVGTAWPRDPVLGEVGRTTFPLDAREATRVGAELAARVRDRVTEVYGLGDEAHAASGEPAAVAAEPPAS